jgi:DNA topoisomerase-1
LGVDIEADFAPQYTILPGKGNLVRRLFKAMSEAEAIYIATDPDREGEAIAWHLLALAKLPEEKPVYRVCFSAITQAAVLAGVANPRPLDLNLIEAQQARRIVDRLVGYLVSPLAGQLLHQNVSAGRVQSVCLRLVVEREREIAAFTPAQYWTLNARLKTAEGEFTAPLNAVKGVKAVLKQREPLDRLVQGLSGATFWVGKVAQGERTRRPLPPFTTSTLQQAASKALGFSPDKTMQIAQMLYEAGQITYHRTDSVVVASEAVEAAREHIRQTYGEAYLPEKPQAYTTAAQHAQEAHEAIRPTDAAHLPGSPEETAEGARLYALIWQRFAASQMADARYIYRAAQILAGKAQGQPYPLDFRVGSRALTFDGFLKVYEEAPDEDEQPVPAESLPPLVEGQMLTLAALQPEAHTTQAPSRYTEAALVKALEERGIGRPSTYAGMVKTLKTKGYARLEHKRLVPTETGLKLCDLLTAKFGGLFDYGYTAQLEEELDRVAGGETTRLATLQTFWANFQPRLRGMKAEVAARAILLQTRSEVCPQCGSPLVKREGAFGPFIGCANFPKCRYTAGGPARPVRFSKKREDVKA